MLKLPEEHRSFLGIPQGDLYVSRTRGLVQGLEADVAVGDVVSRNHTVALRVTDAKTKRSMTVDTGLSRCDTTIVNPPGSISMQAFTASLMKQAKGICVIGEEDLLVIPFTLTWGSVIYGQPDTGVVKTASRERALKILKGLKPHMAIINLKGEQRNG